MAEVVRYHTNKQDLSDMSEKDHGSVLSKDGLLDSDRIGPQDKYSLEESRGRQMRLDNNRHGFVKNIPKAAISSGELLPTPPKATSHSRIRESSNYTSLKDNLTPHANLVRFKTKSTDSTASVFDKRSNTSNKSNSRLGSAIWAYTDQGYADTIALSYSHAAYQQSNKRHSSRPKLTESSNSSKSGKSLRSFEEYFDKGANQRNSVSMEGGTVPAFDDLTIDIGDEITDVDGSLKMEQEVTEEEGKNLEFKPWTKGHLGRIQQKVNHLKEVAQEEENSLNTKKFQNLKQKVVFEFLSNDLRSLRRFNENPLLLSLNRTSSMEKTKDVQVDPTKLKCLLKNATEKLEQIWVDEPKVSYENPKSQVTLSGEKLAGDFDKFPESHTIHEQFDGFMIGSKGSFSGWVDASPKTLKYTE